jgi:hypothetical protein
MARDSPLALKRCTAAERVEDSSRRLEGAKARNSTASKWAISTAARGHYDDAQVLRHGSG